MFGDNSSRNRIEGNGNTIRSSNVIHHHHNAARRKESKKGDGKEAIGALGFVVLIACWQFVRHSPEVYFGIRVVALLSFALVVTNVIFAFVWGKGEKFSVPSLVVGAIASSGSIALTVLGQLRLGNQLVAFSRESPNVWSYWTGLTSNGNQLVLRTLGEAVCSVLAAILALLLSLRVLSSYLADVRGESEETDEFLPRISRSYGRFG